MSNKTICFVTIAYKVVFLIQSFQVINVLYKSYKCIKVINALNKGYKCVKVINALYKVINV